LFRNTIVAKDVAPMAEKPITKIPSFIKSLVKDESSTNTLCMSGGKMNANGIPKRDPNIRTTLPN
jgi:hypothetical protein